ncbi:MAG: DUF2336 domain-containing protein, partial [Pseudomonadota bacterium]
MSYLDVQTALFSGSAAEHTLNQVNEARTLGKQIADGGALDASEHAIELLKSDISEIRQSLAFELRLTPVVPETLAQTIATSDDPEVAGPFLESSPVVTESFILNILDQLSAHSQTAVAKRPDVTDRVAHALIDIGHEVVLVRLVRNEKAGLEPSVFERISAAFPDNPRITRVVAEIIPLNAPVSEKAASEPPTAQQSPRLLPFNVLVSRARAFHFLLAVERAQSEIAAAQSDLQQLEAEAAIAVQEWQE